MTSLAQTAVLDGTATEITEPLPRQTGALAPRPAASVPAAVTPLDMMRLALEQRADVATLRDLMALHREWQADEARKAWVVAMAAFKAEPLSIAKNKAVKFGNTEYSHVTLDALVEAVVPLLAKHGLGHRWEVTQDDKAISVTCCIFHVLGHTERVTMRSGPDTSGSKNAIQGIASARTYLARYTLESALGLAAYNEDDDGRDPPPGGAMISEAEKNELVELLRETGADVKRFLAHFRVENIDQLPLARFAEAKAALERKRNKAAAGGAQ